MDPITISTLISLLGLAAGGAGALFNGKREPSTQQIPTVSPQQTQLMNIFGQMGLGKLQQSSKPFDFGPYEQRARQQFATQTQPTMAQRFASTLQGNNKLINPQFGDYIGRSSSDLESQLANLRAQYDLQSQDRERTQGLNLANLGLGSQFQNVYEPRTESPWPDIFKSASNSLLKYGQNYGMYEQPSSQQTYKPSYPSRNRLGGPSVYGQGPLQSDMQNAFLYQNRGGI